MMNEVELTKDVPAIEVVPGQRIKVKIDGDVKTLLVDEATHRLDGVVLYSRPLYRSDGKRMATRHKSDEDVSVLADDDVVHGAMQRLYEVVQAASTGMPPVTIDQDVFTIHFEGGWKWNLPWPPGETSAHRRASRRSGEGDAGGEVDGAE